jgi:hypothetical protein
VGLHLAALGGRQAALYQIDEARERYGVAVKFHLNTGKAVNRKS